LEKASKVLKPFAPTEHSYAFENVKQLASTLPICHQLRAFQTAPTATNLATRNLNYPDVELNNL